MQVYIEFHRKWVAYFLFAGQVYFIDVSTYKNANQVKKYLISVGVEKIIEMR